MIGEVIRQLWPASAIGLVLTAPPGWLFDPFSLALSNGTDVEYRNVDEPFAHGGMLLPGAAVIRANRKPRPNIPLSRQIDLDMAHYKIESQSDPEIGGVRAKRVDTVDYWQEGEGFTIKQPYVYVERGDSLYTFTLEYHDEEAAASDVLTTFDQVLRSVRFTR